MVKFHDLSIRYKLIFISLIISGLVISIASATFFIKDIVTMRNDLISGVKVTAQLVASTSAGPVSFDYQTEAGRTLAAVKADVRIAEARIYDKEGHAFATYHFNDYAKQQIYQTTRFKILEQIKENAYDFSEEERDLLWNFFKSLEQFILTDEMTQAVHTLIKKESFPLTDKQKQHIKSLITVFNGSLPNTLTTSKQFMGNTFFEYSTLLSNTSDTNEKISNAVGYVLVHASLTQLHERKNLYILLVLAVIALSILLSFVLSARMQKSIVSPILSLVKLTEQVSREKNYAVRGHHQSKDELGILYTGVNEMLSAIETRDKALEQHRDELEQKVEDRTAELKRLNKQLTYQAYHDALTNLPNRAMFVQQVEKAVTYAEEQKQGLAMLFIDLDHFKYINDTLGHSAGDRILQEVAKRLLACTRQPEDLVARLGGDEFTVLLRNVREPLNAGIVAGKILKALASPFRFNVQDLYVTPSIGISIYPEDGDDVGGLMRNADTSMYVAKQQGRNNYQFYTAGSNSASENRLHMENKLRQALEFDEFEVWYQPRFDLVSGYLISAEALVRWRTPDLNLVPPSQFIPLAEDTGLIIPIGELVLKIACEENLTWQTEGNVPITVSVNLSARQFVQEDLLGKIESMTKMLNMPHEYLELELTESLIMPNAEETIETLNALKKLGIQISVDDFGTGYSSLSYLKRFPIDILKIDQSFIFDIGDDTDDTALVTAIIAMAHKLKLTVVAEGVETKEQLDFLIKHECDYVQGFLFGKPMPADIFKSLLHERFDMYAYSKIATTRMKEWEDDYYQQINQNKDTLQGAGDNIQH